MVIGEPVHVRISIHNKDIIFDIIYKPETDFVFVKDLNLNNEQIKNLELIDPMFKNLSDNDQVEVYSGKLRMHGILYLKSFDGMHGAVAARTLLIPEDTRFQSLTNKIMETVKEEEYNLWADFDESTRYVNQEKQLFDMVISLFRVGLLDQMVRRLDYVKSVKSHADVEWISSN